uniref:Uncharacterized protein n=1 Tax=uncultured marine virus TaxID=186617 RepID=A0A0F7L8S3_9VIRU|nr:hypothetical protein [uncultured marine virus]
MRLVVRQVITPAEGGGDVPALEVEIAVPTVDGVEVAPEFSTVGTFANHDLSIVRDQ